MGVFHLDLTTQSHVFLFLLSAMLSHLLFYSIHFCWDENHWKLNIHMPCDRLHYLLHILLLKKLQNLEVHCVGYEISQICVLACGLCLISSDRYV